MLWKSKGKFLAVNFRQIPSISDKSRVYPTIPEYIRQLQSISDSSLGETMLASVGDKICRVGIILKCRKIPSVDVGFSPLTTALPTNLLNVFNFRFIFMALSICYINLFWKSANLLFEIWDIIWLVVQVSVGVLLSRLTIVLGLV